MMSAGRKAPFVREIEILGDEETGFLLCSSPDVQITAPAQSFVQNRVHIETQRAPTRRDCHRKALVEFQLHATLRSGGTGLGAGRSSLAAVAANAMTAWTSASVRLGKSRRIAGAVCPSER